MAHVYDEIYRIVQNIPKGRVLTYGVISDLIGKRMSAQGVGWALKALGSEKRKNSAPKGEPAVTKTAPKPNKKSGKTKQQSPASFDMESVPWQRVVNSQGGTSTHKIAEIPPGLQQHLLEREGVKFDEEGKLDLTKYLWYEGLGDSKLSPPKRKSTARDYINRQVRL
jgi:methylated-DNA-protein-cysteine methyltransferase-like protein